MVIALSRDVFAAVELDEDAPPELLVVAVVEEVDRLRRAADVLERPGERREVPRLAAQRAHELACGGVALQQAAGDSEDNVYGVHGTPWVSGAGGCSGRDPRLRGLQAVMLDA